MPPSLTHMRTLLAAYLDRNPDERGVLAELLDALEASGDPTERSALPGHVTCSAVVIDRHRRVLHIRHKASGGLVLCPGGHVEATDGTLPAAALREVEEETGIPASALVPAPEFRDGPVDIDVHDIAPGPVKGEPGHRHYDFRFVFRLADDAPGLTLRTEEVTGAVWLPFEEVSSPSLRGKLAASAPDGAIVPVNASAIVHDGHGRYLLHLRDANKPWIWEPGCWSLLGGGREPQDRTLRDTIVRELAEEAGLTVAGLEPYAVENVTGTDGTRVPIQLFTGLWSGDPARLRLTEGVMLAWVTPEKFPYMTMLETTRALLERHAAEHPAPAEGPGAEGAESVAEPSGRLLHVVGVHLYLEHDDRVLLGLRHPDSVYAGGSWHALAGHCEAETATACLVREAYEEAGLVIDPADVELVHTVHMRERPASPPRVQLFFRARRWEGTPELREPDKCVAWRWWSAKDLPEPIVPYARAAIEGIRAGRTYTELEWAR
ncbi:NUDIX domain-containing protein [Streptomyces sp. NPDC035033]|uniref:NUDIX domain-containing protein n=1 Tax=Streptomyces sp. NPDC035033 TaxID=3155368 RepID=UPI0033FF8B8B